METWSGVAVALALGIDGLAVGAAYGMRRIRVPARSLLIIGLCSAVCFFIAMTAGAAVGGAAGCVCRVPWAPPYSSHWGCGTSGKAGRKAGISERPPPGDPTARTGPNRSQARAAVQFGRAGEGAPPGARRP